MRDIRRSHRFCIRSRPALDRAGGYSEERLRLLLQSGRQKEKEEQLTCDLGNWKAVQDRIEEERYAELDKISQCKLKMEYFAFDYPYNCISIRAWKLQSLQMGERGSLYT